MSNFSVVIPKKGDKIEINLSLLSGRPVSQDCEYYIEPEPSFIEVSVGAVMKYYPHYKGRRRPILDPKDRRLGSPSPYRDSFLWTITRLNAKGEVERTETWPGDEFKYSYGLPGRYQISLCVVNNVTNDRKYCYFEQRVVQVEPIMSQLMGAAHKRPIPHPDEALSRVDRGLKNLKIAHNKFPNPAKEDEFNQAYDARCQARDKLEHRLHGTGHLHFKVPFFAVHLEFETQQRTLLNIYVVEIPKPMAQPRDLYFFAPPGVAPPDFTPPPGITAEKLEEVGDNLPGRQTWHLVDWTVPEHETIGPELEVDGDSDEEAIKTLLDKWAHYNRYPKGKIQYEFSHRGLTLSGEFETDGETSMDKITGVFEVGAIVLMGAAALLAPVPGSFATWAMWAGALSSTAACALKIMARHEEGIDDWRADMMDGLTITSNLLMGVGQAARVATLSADAGWAEGAAVKFLDAKNEVVRMTLIGQVADDGMQGILVADKQLEEYHKLMTDSSLSPNERSDKLFFFILSNAGTAGMTAFSIGSNLKELGEISQPLKHLGEGKKFGTTDDAIKPPKEKLDKLGKKGEEVDLTTLVPLEGKVKPPAKGRNHVQTHDGKVTKLPPWVERLGPDIKFARGEEEVAKYAGISPQHMENWKKFCKENDVLIVTRFTNPSAMKFQGMEGYVAKPHACLLKSEKSGPFAGLVRHPQFLEKSRPMEEWERAEMDKLLNQKGWKVEEKTGLLNDASGNRVYGDYDVMGVYQQVGSDRAGKPMYQLLNMDDWQVMGKMNREITPGVPMFQHPAQDQYWKLNEGSGRFEIGRQPGDDEKFAIFTEAGDAFMLETPKDLKSFYESNNLGWVYGTQDKVQYDPSTFFGEMKPQGPVSLPQNLPSGSSSSSSPPLQTWVN